MWKGTRFYLCCLYRCIVLSWDLFDHRACRSEGQVHLFPPSLLFPWLGWSMSTFRPNWEVPKSHIPTTMGWARPLPPLSRMSFNSLSVIPSLHLAYLHPSPGSVTHTKSRPDTVSTLAMVAGEEENGSNLSFLSKRSQFFFLVFCRNEQFTQCGGSVTQTERHRCLEHV